MRLDKGTKYSPEALTLTGWTSGDGTGHEGYNVADYFTAEGIYHGPDCHGIEPEFDFPQNRTVMKLKNETKI